MSPASRLRFLVLELNRPTLRKAAAGEYGYVAPFGLAIIPLALCGLLVTYGWRENYGDAKLDAITGLGNAWEVIRSDPKVLLLGIAQSAFEGSMYTFVFMWTPAIATPETKATLPYGTIFAVFMVCCALGSSLFSYAMRKGMNVFVIPKYVTHTLSPMCFSITNRPENVGFCACCH